METVKEFLESSTIHGLTYISSAHSRLAKAFWSLVVLTGFSCAIYLINDSYVDWQASPIATSISTHPISELEFPTITICPPEGSNTALNYDLDRAKNITLTERDRERLINIATQILIDNPSQDFVHLARDLLGKDRILELFKRKTEFSYPMTYIEREGQSPSFEIWSSKLNGSYKTPGFGKKNFCNETVKGIHFVLTLPLVVMNNAGNASFDLEIKVHNDRDWQIQYREGPKYVSYSEPDHHKSWDDAEGICQSLGGHLASVKNLYDKFALDTGTFMQQTWLGGTDRALEGAWVWPDGVPFAQSSCTTVTVERRSVFEPCTRWAAGEPKGGEKQNCLSSQQSSWISEKCSDPRPFACQIDPINIPANENKTYKLEEIHFPSFELWLQENENHKEHNCEVSDKMPGFSLRWNTSGSKRYAEVFDVIKVVEKMEGERGSYYELKTYLNFVTKNVRYRFVRPAKQYNMTDIEMWDTVKSWKKETAHKKLVVCLADFVKEDYFSILFDGLRKKLPSNRPKIDYKETDDDLLLAFDIFSYLIFCQNEALELEIFFENLIRTGSTPSILQGVSNTEKMNHKKETVENAKKQMFKALSTLLDLKLSQILVAGYDSNPTEMENQTSYARAFEQNSNDNFELLDATQLRIAASMSNHPVAVYDKNGLISPSSLIPFCSFGSKMLGTKVPNMTFPVCDIFKPTVYKGRLCYKANLQKASGQLLFEGKGSGMMMLIDINKEKSMGANILQRKNNSKLFDRDVYFGTDGSSNENMAIIHIDTLAQYTGYGPGDYALTSIKQMTGTDNFLAWPENKRQCALETYKDCQTKVLLEDTVNCGCTPFQLLPAVGNTSEQVHIVHIWC